MVTNVKSIKNKLAIKQFVSLALIQIVFFGLPACQSQPTYRAYPGTKAEDEIATLLVPIEFNLVNVDGKSYNQPLLANGIRIKFPPGTHQIVIKYVDFWDINADDHAKVASQPMLLKFSVAAGQRYAVVFDEPQNIKEAKAFASNPNVNIINKTTGTDIGAQTTYQLEEKSFLANFMESLTGKDKAPAAPEQIADVSPPANPAANATEARALEMLKYWWQKADARQQQAFMQWLK